MFFSRRKNDDLSEKLVKLVVPIAIQQFMLALVSATDAVMLGFVDQTSLSAASLAGQIQFVLNLFIAGITAGSGIMISQYWGKKDIKAIERSCRWLYMLICCQAAYSLFLRFSYLRDL